MITVPFLDSWTWHRNFFVGCGAVALCDAFLMPVPGGNRHITVGKLYCRCQSYGNYTCCDSAQAMVYKEVLRLSFHPTNWEINLKNVNRERATSGITSHKKKYYTLTEKITTSNNTSLKGKIAHIHRRFLHTRHPACLPSARRAYT